jgi:hypothetical protein
MAKFTFIGKLFEEKSEGEIIAKHTVFFIESYPRLGEWHQSTIENALEKSAGTFSQEIYRSQNVIVRTFFSPAKLLDSVKVNAILIEDFNTKNPIITIYFPFQEFSVDSMVDALETCKM